MNEPTVDSAAAANRSGGASAGEPVLKAHGLTKAFALGHRSVEVLRGVNLEVERGGMVAIRGASGAGKSTLLHLLGGLDRPDAGSVRFDGTELTALPPSDLARFRNRRVGFVFQAYHLLPELDALENVCLPAHIAREPVRLTLARGRTLLAEVGLGHRAEHRPAELSGGEQQRVAIARALINEPDLVLADEPTGNLDSRTGEGIVQLLLRLRQQRGVTLILATHDARVAAHALKVADLADGVIGGGPSADPGTGSV
jgi:ABC-type lipoprotein export system ATPase subunit